MQCWLLQAHETIIRTSFRRRFDMEQVSEALAAPRPLTGTLGAVSLTTQSGAAARTAASRPRDVVIRSSKDS